jgi:hypothetical protein
VGDTLAVAVGLGVGVGLPPWGVDGWPQEANATRQSKQSADKKRQRIRSGIPFSASTMLSFHTRDASAAPLITGVRPGLWRMFGAVKLAGQHKEGIY